MRPVRVQSRRWCIDNGVECEVGLRLGAKCCRLRIEVAPSVLPSPLQGCGIAKQLSSEQESHRDALSQWHTQKSLAAQNFREGVTTRRWTVPCPDSARWSRCTVVDRRCLPFSNALAASNMIGWRMCAERMQDALEHVTGCTVHIPGSYQCQR